MPTPRKPTSLRALEGNRSHEPKGRSPAPTLRADPPACPSHLHGHARREWNRLAPELFSHGLLTEWDLALFEAYCINVAVARMAHDAWVADDCVPTVPSYRGGAVRHPALRALAAAENTLLAISKRFGLTPADRQPLTVAELPDSELESIFHPVRHRGPRGVR